MTDSEVREAQAALRRGGKRVDAIDPIAFYFQGAGDGDLGS